MKRFNFKAKTLIISIFIALSVVCVGGVATAIAANSQRPTITVNYGEYTADSVPNGLIDNPYTIFDVDVKDMRDSEPELVISVYKNYSVSASRSRVSVENGTFTPKSSGNYTIEYVATNAYGASTTVTVLVKVLSSADDIVITVDNVVGAKQGYEFDVPTASATGDERLGNISISTELYYGEEDMELKGDSYIPMYSGEYTIKYIAKDYSGRREVLTKKFNVEHTEELMSYDDVENYIPSYFVSGNKYELPTISVYKFGTDTYEKKDCTIKVDGVTVQNNEYVATVPTHACEMEIEYSYESFSKKYTATGIKTRSGEELDTTKLFIPTGLTTVGIDEKGLYFDFNNDTDSVTFANPLILSDFSFVFAVDESANKYSGVFFEITDEYNAEERIELRFTNKNVYINGNKKDTPVNFDGKNNNVTINNKVLNVGGRNFNIETYANGEAFNGFSSQSVKFRCKIENKSGNAKLRVSTLNGNYFFKNVDYAKPKIAFLSDLSLTYSINDEFVIPSVLSSDVIDGKIDTVVTLLYNEEPLTSIDGIEINEVDAKEIYKVQLKNYGIYYLTYSCSDTSGNPYEYQILVRVLDEIKPEITVNGVPTSARVNSTVNLPRATVVDNVTRSEDMPVYVLVINPNRKYIHVSGDTFTPDKTGNWIIRYYTYDEAGNLIYKDYTVKVR